MATANERKEIRDKARMDAMNAMRSSPVDSPSYQAALIKLLLIQLDCKRRHLPLWSIVGNATSHGSTLSSEIVCRYFPEHVG